MARGGQVIYKKASANKRKPKSKHDSEDEDDEDEEYKLEEDDDYDEDDSRHEESFDFAESDDDDDDFVEKPKKQKKGRNSRKKREKLDPDFELDDDFDDEEVKMAKNRKNIKKNGRNQESSDSEFKLNESDDELSFKGRRKDRVTEQEVLDSDYELDDMLAEKSEENPRIGDEEMEDLPVPKNGRTGRRGKHEVSDSDFELDKLDEEEEFDIHKSKRKRKSGLKSRVSDAEVDDLPVSRKRGKGRRTRGVSDSDSDYELEDENEEDDFERLDNCVNSRVCNDDEIESVSVVKRRTVKPKKKKMKTKIGLRGKEKSRNHKYEESDYELDEEDEDNDDDFSPELDEFDDDDISIARKKKSTTRGRVKSRRSRVTESSGDEFVVKDRVTVGSKGRQSKNVKKKSAENNIEHLDIDDDFVESDLLRINSHKNGGKNVKKRRRKKRLRNNSESSDSDFVISEDVDEEDEYEEVVEEEDFEFEEDKEKNNQKENTGKPKWGRKKCRSAIDSESFESDYLISEDDDEFIVDQPKMRSKRSNKKKAKHNQPRRRIKSTVYSDSDSDSFNFDDPISEEEFSDLGMESPKKIVSKRKIEEKGKEKQANNESGKQVCGICLSEEKKSVIQGLLDCCAHYFCFACIMEWSKVETRCPLCKGRFGTISKLGQSTQGFGSKRSSVIKVHKRDQVYQPSEEELRGMLDPYENVVCMECQLGGDDNLMLLCDTCDSSAHTYCVGLGREVPEGNWYCELCRSVNHDLPSISQTQTNTAILHQEPVGPSLFPEVGTITNSPRPSSLGIDLNALPRDFNGDDQLVTTPNSGNGASTVLGRRHIRQRIHVILSNNRQRQNNLFSFEQSQLVSRQNISPLTSLGPNLGPNNFNEGSSFRHVEGAKEEVQHMVKSRMKNLKQDRQLEYSVFKEIARKATHTILAACGIEHNRNMVSIFIETPDNCAHSSNDGPRHLLKDCCSSCFKQYVNDVVQRTISLILGLRSHR